jgi:hypothetical protein
VVKDITDLNELDSLRRIKCLQSVERKTRKGVIVSGELLEKSIIISVEIELGEYEQKEKLIDREWLSKQVGIKNREIKR